MGTILSLFTQQWGATLFALFIFLASIIKYFWPCLKLKPVSKIFSWCKVRWMSNYSFIKGAMEGTQKFGGICIEPSW
jgi:hypothetical protein